MKKLSREEVYKMIDSEREYQDTHHFEETDEKLSVADWIIFMETHLEKAKDSLYRLDEQNALDQVRKITALGVATMEYKGGDYRHS